MSTQSATADASSSRVRLQAQTGSTAQEVIEHLAPMCNRSLVFTRMRRENICTDEELASLDRVDLEQLGLTMLERSLVQSWAREAFPDGGMLTPTRLAPTVKKITSRNWSHIPLSKEDVDEQIQFWGGLVKSWARDSGALPHREINIDDVREVVLEELFDLSPTTVREAYDSMRADPDGHISALDFGQGLQRCGLPKLDEATLERILGAIDINHDGTIQLSEFESAISKLMLSRLLEARAVDPDLKAQTPAAMKKLQVTDYNVHGIDCEDVTESTLCTFLFRHSAQNASLGIDARLARWIHMPTFDSSVLLALAVKYSLHPLAVEAVLMQCPTKTDHFELAHLIVIEKLFLNSSADGTEVVQISGEHISLFCMGEPSLDTVITVLQPSKTFALESPKVASDVAERATEDIWARLHHRLKRPRSRVRQGGAQFFVYAVIDVSADDLVTISHAYVSRIGKLEEQLRQMGSTLPPSWMSEVMHSRGQIGLVTRHIRGLQRAVRRVQEDQSLSEGTGTYLEDVIEHLDEAIDDTHSMIEKCGAIIDDYHHAVEMQAKNKRRIHEVRLHKQEAVRCHQADRQNGILFVLTIVTTVFTPLSFVCGVYGMNFVDTKRGRSSMPELTWKYGYMFFWICTSIYLVMSIGIAFCLWFGFWGEDGFWYPCSCFARRSSEEESTRRKHSLGGETSKDEGQPLLAEEWQDTEELMLKVV